LGGLDFDIGVHREAIEVLTNSGLNPASIDAILRARNVALVELPDSRLSVGVGSNTAIPSPSDGTTVKVVFTTDLLVDAEKVKSDVEKYFLRHFPGRTTQNDLPSQTGSGKPCVYVVYRKARG